MTQAASDAWRPHAAVGFRDFAKEPESPVASGSPPPPPMRPMSAIVGAFVLVCIGVASLNFVVGIAFAMDGQMRSAGILLTSAAASALLAVPLAIWHLRTK